MLIKVKNGITTENILSGTTSADSWKMFFEIVSDKRKIIAPDNILAPPLSQIEEAINLGIFLNSFFPLLYAILWITLLSIPSVLITTPMVKIEKTREKTPKSLCV
jgi:hypothetical protein